MKILGYSERGMVSSLFNEIAYSGRAIPLLAELLKHVRLVESDLILGSIADCQIIIEQSFSDFGDPDALLLLTLQDANETKKKRIAIFIEAKVKPFHRTTWSIQKEWEKRIYRKDGLEKVSTSNLFMQLYLKKRLVDALRSGDSIDNLPPALFEIWSSKEKRKIGKNGVVKKSAGLLRKHLDDTYFIAIVPDEEKNVDAFISDHDKDNRMLKWEDVKDHFGYITWQRIHDFCENNGLGVTLNAFAHNEGQIFIRH